MITKTILLEQPALRTFVSSSSARRSIFFTSDIIFAEAAGHSGCTSRITASQGRSKTRGAHKKHSHMGLPSSPLRRSDFLSILLSSRARRPSSRGYLRFHAFDALRATTACEQTYGTIAEREINPLVKGWSEGTDRSDGSTRGYRREIYRARTQGMSAERCGVYAALSSVPSTL